MFRKRGDQSWFRIGGLIQFENVNWSRYASWFIKFKGFRNEPYPGGQGASQNNSNSYHVPACDFYNNGTAPRCSGFYHDQEQTPEHPGGGKLYPVDGDCIEQCDCGSVNPCGEVCCGRTRPPPSPSSFCRPDSQPSIHPSIHPSLHPHSLAC